MPISIYVHDFVADQQRVQFFAITTVLETKMSSESSYAEHSDIIIRNYERTESKSIVVKNSIAIKKHGQAGIL